MITQLNPFTDRVGDKGSPTAESILKMLEPFADLPQAGQRFKTLVQAQGLAQIVYRYSTLLILAANYRQNLLLAMKESPVHDALLAPEATEENENLAIYIDENWRYIRRTLLGKLSTTKAQEINLTIEAPSSFTDGHLLVGWTNVMYQKLAQKENWIAQVLDTEGNTTKGYNKIRLRIVGNGAYDRLKDETGIHTIQYKNEKKGKIFQNNVTVVVTPVGDTLAAMGEAPPVGHLVLSTVRHYDTEGGRVRHVRSLEEIRFSNACEREILMESGALRGLIDQLMGHSQDLQLRILLQDLLSNEPSMHDLAVRLHQVLYAH